MAHQKEYVKNLFGVGVVFLSETHIVYRKDHYQQSACSLQRIKTDGLFFLSFQAAQIVLISLFELNTPEFTMLLGALPKTFQDGATKLLHNHLKNSSNTSVVRGPCP